MQIFLNESSSYEKKYKCPYCDARYKKSTLISHIENKHEDMIPEGFTPSRIVFNIINKKDHGTCIECKGESPWNEEKGRYDRLCGKQACSISYRRKTEERIKKIYGKTSQELLKDPNHQTKMLAGRRISGVYRWNNGDLKTYTGSYELECLKFCESFGFNSEDVITPGPVVNYYFGGQKHIWITDIYIAPYGLAIDCKDGGDNPNNRSMKEYRAKQIAKEKAIVEQGKYNYIRLTNNNFKQLIEALTVLKLQYLENNKNEKFIKINENMMSSIAGFMPPENTDNVYIVNYMKNNVFSEDIGITNNLKLEKIIVQNDDGILEQVSKEFLEDCDYTIYKTKGDISDIISNIGSEVSENFIYETVFEKKMYTKDQLLAENIEEVYDIYQYYKTLENIVTESLSLENLYVPTLENNIYQDTNSNYFFMNNGLRTASRENKDFSKLEISIIKNGLF